MNSNEQNTFDELIEAMWAGELGEAGKARMEALAAGDPALGERLRRERGISAVLAGHGPNRAPEGLAKAVFARLDLETKPAEKQQSERARVIPRSVWFMPAFRWGLAAAALVAIFAQVTWLLNRDRMGGGTIATLQTVPLKTPNAMTPKGDLARYTPPKPTPTQSATPTPQAEQTIVLHMVIPTEPEPTGTPVVAQRTAPVRATPTETMSHGLTAKQIMRTITDAGGAVKGIQPIRSNPQVWRVEGSIPEAATANLVERLEQIGIKPARTETVLPYQFKAMQGESLLHRAETTTATGHRETPANKQATTIPLTVIIEETPARK